MIQHPPKPPATHKRRAQRGITLIELAISMVIFSVMGVAVASLIASGMDAQIARRVNEYQVNVSNNIIDRLRMDLMMADNITSPAVPATPTPPGIPRTATQSNTLTFRTLNPNTGVTETVTWRFASNAITRQAQGGPAVQYGLSPSPNIIFQISCGGMGFQCFEYARQQGKRQIILHDLTVIDVTAGGNRVDNQFGKARYRVNEYAFDIKPGETFQ